MKFTIHNCKSDEEFVQKIKHFFKFLVLLMVITFFYNFGPLFGRAILHVRYPVQMINVIANNKIWDEIEFEKEKFVKYYLEKSEWDSDIKRGDLNVIERKL